MLSASRCSSECSLELLSVTPCTDSGKAAHGKREVTFPLRLQCSSKQLWSDSPIRSSPQGRWTSSQEPRWICFQRQARTFSPDFLNHFRLPGRLGGGGGRSGLWGGEQGRAVLQGCCLRGSESGQIRLQSMGLRLPGDAPLGSVAPAQRGELGLLWHLGPGRPALGASHRAALVRSCPIPLCPLLHLCCPTLGLSQSCGDMGMGQTPLWELLSGRVHAAVTPFLPLVA